jgi:hypothetical protein
MTNDPANSNEQTAAILSRRTTDPDRVESQLRIQLSQQIKRQGGGTGTNDGRNVDRLLDRSVAKQGRDIVGRGREEGRCCGELGSSDCVGEGGFRGLEGGSLNIHASIDIDTPHQYGGKRGKRAERRRRARQDEQQRRNTLSAASKQCQDQREWSKRLEDTSTFATIVTESKRRRRKRGEPDREITRTVREQSKGGTNKGDVRSAASPLFPPFPLSHEGEKRIGCVRGCPHATSCRSTDRRHRAPGTPRRA